MIGKWNVFRIVGDQIDTLKPYQGERVSRLEVLLFFGPPSALSGLLSAFDIKISSELANMMITSLSIFSALLFNLLILVYDVVKKEGGRGRTSLLETLRRRLLGETFSNISFAILVSLGTLILLVSLLLLPDCPESSLAASFITALVYFLLGLFVLDLLAVLKRVHILLSKEFGRF